MRPQGGVKVCLVERVGVDELRRADRAVPQDRAWMLAKYGGWIALAGTALAAGALWRWRIRA